MLAYQRRKAEDAYLIGFSAEFQVDTLRIALFTTGGTIDGADSDRGTLRSESDAARWLAAQPNVTVTATALLNKDSREITVLDRVRIAEAIERDPALSVLITHGTYTIAETGRALKAQFGKTTRTILLVGAWVPFAQADSDAPAQLAFALKMFRDKNPGVWISMDGRLWDPDKTEKKEIDPGRYALVEVPR